MRYEPNTRGDVNDRVRLVLGDDELLITEGYDVQQGVLTQPSAFSLRLGHGGLARELFAKYPPRTKFQLYIGEALRFTGWTDGYRGAGQAGATEVTFNGRDVLARLHDACVRADKTYTNRTYGDLVFSAIQDATGEATVISTENTSNRLTLAGLNAAGGAGAGSGVGKKRDPIVATSFQDGLSKAITQIVADQNAAAGNEGDIKQKLATNKAKNAQGAMLAKAGERYYEFLKKELDRAGLCLWATADGEAYVLAAPDGNQAPIAALIRRRGTSGNVVNVLAATYTNDTSRRFSEAIVLARGGGKKTGRTTSSATYADPEMKALGFDRPKVVRDAKCSDAKRAEYFARRTIAEANRAGINYTCTVAGHTFPTLRTGERAVWTPDTVVYVQDDELGIEGPWYVEQVAFKRDPKTTTELTLLRIQDLVFAEDASL